MLLVLTGKEKEKEAMRKKVFAVLLTLCMVLTMMPAVAWAEGLEDYGTPDYSALYYFGTQNDYWVNSEEGGLVYQGPDSLKATDDIKPISEANNIFNMDIGTYGFFAVKTNAGYFICIDNQEGVFSCTNGELTFDGDFFCINKPVVPSETPYTISYDLKKIAGDGAASGQLKINITLPAFALYTTPNPASEDDYCYEIETGESVYALMPINSDIKDIVLLKYNEGGQAQKITEGFTVKSMAEATLWGTTAAGFKIETSAELKPGSYLVVGADSNGNEEARYWLEIISVSDVLGLMYNTGTKVADAPFFAEPGAPGMSIMLIKGIMDEFGKTDEITRLTYEEKEGCEVRLFDSYTINVYREDTLICALSDQSNEQANNAEYKIEISANVMMKSGDENDPVYFFNLNVNAFDENEVKPDNYYGLYKITVSCSSGGNKVFASQMYFYIPNENENEWETLASGDNWYIARDWNNGITNLGFGTAWEGTDEQVAALKSALEVYKNGIDNIIIQGEAQNIPCDYLDKTLGNLSWMDTRENDPKEISKYYVFDSDDAALYAKNGENVDKTTKLVTIKVFNQGDGEEGPQLFIRSEEYDCYPGDGQVGNGMFNVPIQVIFQGKQVTTGYEVFVENEEDGEIVKNNDGTFTYIPKVVGERKVTIKYGELYVDFYFAVEDSDLSGGGEEENGNELNRQRDWTLGKKTGDDKYVPVAPNPIWSEVPTYFMHDYDDSYDNFYVMRKDDAAQVGTGVVQPELVIEGDTFTSVPKGPCDGYWVWKINPTDNQPSNENFDRTKLRVKLNDVSVDGKKETNIWVLGIDYRHSNTRFDWRNMKFSLSIPGKKDFESAEEFFNMPGLSDEESIFYTDMSQPADDDRNSFYVFHEKGTTLKVDATKLYSFDDGGTSLSGNTGGAFEKILDTSDFLELTDTYEEFTFKAGTDEGQDITITYTATKVSLKKYIGYENIRLSFAAISGNNNHPVGKARMEIRNGATIKIEGDTEGVTKFRDAHNILNEALGFPAVTKDFVGGEAYFDKAHATFSEDGQGLVCAFDIALEPGYVIDSITDIDPVTGKPGNPYPYIVKYTYYYDVFDKNGQRLSTLDEMNEAGWWEAIGSQHDGQEREACMAHQEVAISGLNISKLEESVTAFKNFLDKNGYTAKRISAFVDYTVLFDQSQSTKQHSIVFHVSKPDQISEGVSVHGNDSITVDTSDVTGSFKTEAAESNLAQLQGDGLTIEKVYDINATKDNQDITNTDGLVNITVSANELSGNPEDYTVVYFTDEGVPMEMPTTYVEGQGIVFTTGHFSKYAVVKKAGTTDPDPTPNPNPGTSGGGLPTMPTDNVTQSGDTTTADMTGSTVSKDGETTTTVDQTTADKLVDKAAANNSEEIVISAVTKNQSAAASTKSAEVTLPAETLGAIAEKTDADVVIKTDVAEVKLDNKSAEAIADQAQAAGTTENAETVSILVEKVKEEAEEVRFELKVVTSGGKVISDFNGGSVSVTVNVPASLSGKNLVCVYIDDNGMMHKVEGQKNADGTYTFVTGHFSTYAIISEEDADTAIAAQIEAINNIQIKLSTKVTKTKSGKKGIKLTWKADTDIQIDGIEVLRSVKSKSGYKKIYTTKKAKNTGYYINIKSLKKNTKYYYKVRGFVTIDGQKVYTGWSNKGIRTFK